MIALTVEMCDVTFCRYDYLTISNGNNLLFGTFCGYKPGHTVGVSGDSAVITFRSDSYYEERGFLLFFSVQPPGRFVHDYYICNPACLHGNSARRRQREHRSRKGFWLINRLQKKVK